MTRGASERERPFCVPRPTLCRMSRHIPTALLTAGVAAGAIYLVVANGTDGPGGGSSSPPSASQDFWGGLFTPTPSPAPTPSPSPSRSPLPSPSATSLPTPARTPTPSPTPARSPQTVLPAPPGTVEAQTPDGLVVAVHTVVSGDWLSKLAAQYGSQVTDIFEWSRGNLGPNPDQIFPGDQVVVKVLGYR